MADKPPYEIAHKARKAEKWHAPPHNEILNPPDPSGRTTQGGIGEIPSKLLQENNQLIPPKPENLPVKPGEYERAPKYSSITKT